MDNFILKKWINSEHRECDEYIQQLHNYIESLLANPNYKLLQSYKKFTDSLAEDMMHVSTGDTDKLKVLSNSKDDRAFDRAMVVLKSADSFDKIAKMTEGLKPTIEEEEKVETVKIKKGANVLETITRQIKE